MPTKKIVISVLLFVALLSFSVITFAVEIEVKGEGAALVTPDVAQVQLEAQKAATKNAINVAVDRIMGAGMSKDPKVRDKLDYLASQLDTYRIKQVDTPRREGDNYVISTLLIVDDAKFRKIIADAGIASGASTARSAAVLTVMDEFFTSPSDFNAPPQPFKEVTTFKYDHDAAYKEQEVLSAKGASSNFVSKNHKESGAATVSGQAGASYSDTNTPGVVNAQYADKSAFNGQYSQGASRTSSSSNKSQLAYNGSVNASDSEHAFFENVKEWQPKNTSAPAKESYTLGALGEAFRTYDIRSLSNELFRSKYFADKVVTIEKLENSQDLASYVKFAKVDAKADFFAVGTSVIVDRGPNPSTGRNTCDGMAVVKVYSTTDGETIASSALTESASGGTSDQCRANVAKKVGSGLGSTIASQIQDYWKTRQMYGSEYVVLLLGDFPTMARIQFTNVLKQVEGVQNVKLRTTSSGKAEFVLNYNGGGQLGDNIFIKLADSPLSVKFANYETDLDGNQITLHPPAPAPAATKQPVQKKK